MPNPPSTDDIILDRVIQGTDCQRCVDWAIGMLMIGYDADYLCRLAGQLPPFDLDSISTLRDRALGELGFDDLSSEALICCSVANSLQRHGNDELPTRKILESAKWLYVTRDIRSLQPLYLLSHGLYELDEFGEQWYVDGMNRANVSQIAKHIVDAFVRQHAKSP